jgi:hypothetical protein
MGDSAHSFSMPIPRTSFGWWLLCGRIITKFPYDPDPNSFGNQQYPSYGLRDGEHERDGYVTFSWVHTFNSNMLLTVSPFYHYNSADYQGGANDYPVISTNDQVANYGGLQATFDEHFWRNDAQAGVYAFGQHQYDLFENNSRTAVKTSPPLRLA